MQISAASLYNAFGDKRLLFERALLVYVGDTFSQKEGGPIGLEAIRAFLEKVVTFSVKDPQRKGCLLVNSALEVAPHDSEISKIIAGVMQQVEDFFLRCIKQGQASGEIQTLQSASDLAKQLLAVLLGMRVLARVRPERQLFDGLLRSTLSSIAA
jgi:TetR/AcrR family transcriptional repressor of nem operon